jgi:hypothetical protein
MPFTQGNFGVEWEEYFQGWAESWAEDNVSLYRGALVPWQSGLMFLKDMMGGAQLGGGGAILRTLPEEHPTWARNYVSQIDLLQPHGEIDDGGEKGSIAYDYYLYRVHYTPRPYEVLSDEAIGTGPGAELGRFVERLQSYAVENVTLPAKSFGWSDRGSTGGQANSPIMESQFKVVGTKELTYVWHLVPGVPDASIQLLMGTVNQDIFDVIYPAESLLFMAPEVVRIPLSPGGNPLWRISYKFLYREAGWNKLYRQTGPSGPGFYPIDSRGDGTGDKPFKKNDFKKLYTLA